MWLEIILTIQMFGSILEVQPKVNGFKTEHGRNVPEILNSCEMTTTWMLNGYKSINTFCLFVC